MKSLLVTALPVVAYSLACSPEVPDPVEKKDDEVACKVETNFPTQDARSAVDATLGAAVTGTLCPLRDTDGYRVTVANVGDVIRVHLSMATNLTNVEIGYVILKDNGTAIADPTGIDASDQGRSAGEPADFIGAHRIEEPGTYIVVVRDVENQSDSYDDANEYTLTIDVIPDPDPQEPNNTPGTATLIGAGDSTGVIATSGDQDWYSIDVLAAAQIVDVTVSADPDAGVDHQATLLGTILAEDPETLELGEVQVILQSAPLVSDGAALSARLRKPASDGLDEGRVGEPYFIVIEDADTDGAGTVDDNTDAQIDPALGEYTVSVTLLADPDTNETAFGNENPDTATPVSAPQTFTGALATIADSDVYRVTPPADASPTNPYIILVTTTFAAGFDAEVSPQLNIVHLDPEIAPGEHQVCNNVTPCAEPVPQSEDEARQLAVFLDRSYVCLHDGTPNGGGVCGETRMQRFITTSPVTHALPLRTRDPVFIQVNDFADDEFQETGTYTIEIEVVADDDAGEIGEDFLLPNLEEAGYSNDFALEGQRGRSFNRAREVTLGYAPLCPEDAPADGCLDLALLPAPIGDFGFDDHTVVCGDVDAGDRTVTLTGKLAYEGDRDFFEITDYPARGYFGIDLVVRQDTASPVELALFVYNGGDIDGSTLFVAEQGGCSEQQGGPAACAPGTICVDERCWDDTDANPVIPSPGNDGLFGPEGTGQCVTTGGPRNPPIRIEVVDNGLNDFDRDMEYQIDVEVRCGCAAACETPADFCQDG